jgi:hypothetical protein
MDVAAGDAAVMKQKADVMEFELDLEDLNKQINECMDDVQKKRLDIEYLRKKAEYIRLLAALENFELNYEGAKRELIELNEILDQLKPMCKYWNEDILKMEQDMQNDEWTGELKNRAENMLLSNRLGIPYDHLSTMRQHPEFFDKILPHITNVASIVNQVNDIGAQNVLSRLPQNEVVNSILQLTHKPEE